MGCVINERLSGSCVWKSEQEGELRRRVSSRYVTPVWSSSSSTIKRLVRFAKLTKVEMCWLSNMSLKGELIVLEILPSHLGNSRTLT